MSFYGSAHCGPGADIARIQAKLKKISDTGKAKKNDLCGLLNHLATNPNKIFCFKKSTGECEININY